MNEQKEFTILDLLTILSFIIAIQNLNLNEKQVNSLNEHLSKQDSILEEKHIKMLEKIMKQNEEIITLLKGGLK